MPDLCNKDEVFESIVGFAQSSGKGHQEVDTYLADVCKWYEHYCPHPNGSESELRSFISTQKFLHKLDQLCTYNRETVQNVLCKGNEDIDAITKDDAFVFHEMMDYWCNCADELISWYE